MAPSRETQFSTQAKKVVFPIPDPKDCKKVTFQSQSFFFCGWGFIVSFTYTGGKKILLVDLFIILNCIPKNIQKVPRVQTKFLCGGDKSVHQSTNKLNEILLICTGLTEIEFNLSMLTCMGLCFREMLLIQGYFY